MKRILCAVDRSPSSLQAFDYAIALARWSGARLTLLEVIEASNAFDVPIEARARLEEDLRRVLVSRRVSDVKVTISLRQGNVVQEILSQARAGRSDLIVMGSHGRGGIQRLVLGSIAEKVLRLATSPVLIVRHGVRKSRAGQSPSRTILCPTDFSVTANQAVAYGKRLAKRANAKLILMNCVEWSLGDVTSGPVAELRESIEVEARKELEGLLPHHSSGKHHPEAVVATGKASAEIVKLARMRSVDLIVMGVSGRGNLDVALLGSTTHQVVREGPCPVLTMRGAQASD